MMSPDSIPWWATASDLARAAGSAPVGLPTVAVMSWSAATVVFLLSGARLSALDLRERRLPRAVIAPARARSAVLLITAAASAWSPRHAAQAVLGSALSWLLCAMLRRGSPRSLGRGDVDYASLTGLIAGFTGWRTIVASAAWTSAGAAVAGVWALTVRRAGMRSCLPFGPFMFAGTLAALTLPAPWG